MTFVSLKKKTGAWLKFEHIHFLFWSFNFKLYYECYLDTGQNFIEHLDAQVLISELFDTELFVQIGSEDVEWYEDDGRGETGKSGDAQVAPEHVDANDDLKRRRPKHVYELYKAKKELSVYRNEVSHFAYGGNFTRRGGKAKTFTVDHVDQSCSDSSSDEIHAKVVVLHDEWLRERGYEEKYGEEKAHNDVLLLDSDEVDDKALRQKIKYKRGQRRPI